MRLPFLYIGKSVTGRDRWQIGFGNVIYWAWYAPKWLRLTR